MKEVRYFYAPSALTTNELPSEEAAHASKVLRLQPGDEVVLIDGKGSFHQAEIVNITKSRCEYQITHSQEYPKTWNNSIHLAIAPTKNIDRIEWLTEKITEIGLDELSFLNCRFSERRVVKNERLERIIVSAVKQSRKSWIPQLNEMVLFKEFISMSHKGLKFIAHCYDQFPKIDLCSSLNKEEIKEDVLILVGPEGDFSVDEVDLALKNGFQSISLGENRLRTETAGLVAVTIAQFALRKNK